MVARDVVDDTRFEKITTSGPRSPGESPQKVSPDQPGYPRGIPNLREDDKPKPIPAAGKPSRPQRRDESPRRVGDKPGSRRYVLILIMLTVC